MFLQVAFRSRYTLADLSKRRTYKITVRFRQINRSQINTLFFIVSIYYYSGKTEQGRGEGSGCFEKLEKPVWRQREDSLTSLEVCYLLKLNKIAS